MRLALCWYSLVAKERQMTDAEKVQELLWALADIHDAALPAVDYDVDGGNHAAEIIERIREAEERIGFGLRHGSQAFASNSLPYAVGV
jgi:hypothetical protein